MGSMREVEKRKKRQIWCRLLSFWPKGRTRKVENVPSGFVASLPLSLLPFSSHEGKMGLRSCMKQRGLATHTLILFPFSICTPVNAQKRTRRKLKELLYSLLSFSSPPNQPFQQKVKKNTSTHWNLTGRQSSNGYKDNLPRKTRTSSRTCPDNLLFRCQYHRGGPMPKNSDHKDPSGYLKSHAVLMVFQFQSPQIRIPWTDTISIIDTGQPGTFRTSHFPALPRHPPNPRPPKPSTQQQHRRPHLHPCRSQSNR